MKNSLQNRSKILCVLVNLNLFTTLCISKYVLGKIKFTSIELHVSTPYGFLYMLHMQASLY